MIIVCLLLCLLLLLSFLVYASYSIQSGIYLRSFCKKHTAEKIVALTFDDGPDSLQTPKVLQVLKEYQVTACFFCIGHKVKGNEAILQKMVAEGHLIGNHSHTHPGSRRFRILARTLSGAGCCVSSVRMLHPIEVYPNCRTAFAIVGLVTPNGGRNKLTGCEVTRSSSH